MMVAGMVSSFRGVGVCSDASALQRALRLQHDWAIDHSAVELSGAG
jgi:hypothetical protein